MSLIYLDIRILKQQKTFISSTEDSRKYATEIFDNISKSETINKIIEYKIDF